MACVELHGGVHTAPRHQGMGTVAILVALVDLGLSHCERDR